MLIMLAVGCNNSTIKYRSLTVEELNLFVFSKQLKKMDTLFMKNSVLLVCEDSNSYGIYNLTINLDNPNTQPIVTSSFISKSTDPITLIANSGHEGYLITIVNDDNLLTKISKLELKYDDEIIELSIEKKGIIIPIEDLNTDLIYTISFLNNDGVVVYTSEY